MKWDRTAPFDKDGDLVHYVADYVKDDYDWRPVKEFKATLTYKDFTRGRSAAYFLFTDKKGREYPMFLKEFDEVVHHLVKGVISGTWIPTKRGTNFGIKLVKPNE